LNGPIGADVESSSHPSILSCTPDRSVRCASHGAVPLWYRPIRPMCPDRPEARTHRTIWTLTDTSTP
jgi:hypothetical protein